MSLSAESAAHRILVVDDSPDNVEVLQVILNWEGFVTVTASSGEEALACVAERPPDLVLLDLILPGLSGCEVTMRMKGDLTTKNIPILILTGMSDSATRARVLAAGAEGFITKPVGRSDLCQRVRDILGLASAASCPPPA